MSLPAMQLSAATSVLGVGKVAKVICLRRCDGQGSEWWGLPQPRESQSCGSEERRYCADTMIVLSHVCRLWSLARW